MKDNGQEYMEVNFNLPDDDKINIQDIVEECPGVFYLSVRKPDSIVQRELYAVLPSAVPEIISEETIAYGDKIEDTYFFEYDKGHNGWHLVQFEVLRYKTKRGLFIDETQSLYGAAIFATEQYPEYFGETIPPRCTPWGLVIRHKRAADGVYFLETDQCEWVLALSFPVWSVSISENAQQYGSFCEEDKRMIQEEAKYLYFQRDKCAPAIYELLQDETYKGIRKFINSQEILETNLYMKTPSYAIAQNLSEVDWLRFIAGLLGIPEEQIDDEQYEKNYIRLYADLTSQEFLKLPK